MSRRFSIPTVLRLSLGENGIEFETTYVDDHIADVVPAARRPRKRAGRAANIEALRREMIEHLRAARDHAFETKEQFGEARLLPRPTQDALGRRVCLSVSNVNRCLRDANAAELRLYWDIALDLEQIMAWKRPIKAGTPGTVRARPRGPGRESSPCAEYP